jgi:RNA 3'-terminal phosphate cyclase (ATP)
VAAVRAAALACGAHVRGAFEGSPDLVFEPGPVTSGDFRFEIATAGAATLILQTVLVPLARAADGSRVEVTGGTHVSSGPSFDYLARHWTAVLDRLGLRTRLELHRAGFQPKGGGELSATVSGWEPRGSLVLEERGALREVRGLSIASRLKGAVAERQRDAAQERLWEQRRIETHWEIASPPSVSPGSFLMLEALFENGRAAFGLVGARGLRAEILGDRAARRLLKFLEGEGAVDPHLADQLAVPMALAQTGGLVTTDETTPHMEAVAATLKHFGIGARTWGRRGGPGGLEVSRC